MKTNNLAINGRKIKTFDYRGGKKGTILGIHDLSGNGYSLQYYVEEFPKDTRFIPMDL